REDDELIFVSNAKTTQHLLMFTNLGNLAYRPVHELADIRWKDVGEHLSQNLVNFASNEEIIYAELVDDFTKETYFAVTSLGQIKRFERQEISPWRTYKSKTAKYAKLKSVEDYVVTVAPIQLEDVILVTYNGYALRFSINDVPVVGSKAAGVKAMNLKDRDHIVSAFIANTTSLYLLTHRGSLKRMAIDVIPTTSRANRGLQVLRELKSKPHRVFKAGPVYLEDSSFEFDLFSSVSNHEGDTFVLEIMSKTGKVYDVDLSQWSFSERTSNGSFVSDKISDEEVFSVKIK
ncbi:TPA: DNA topoisomerase IV subunit A, partial [Streptococcus agalactiae]|nr:DNA topoisomerase IV subunit A [Streptococcus agalactiae]